jgi:purine catabolism regulator
MITVEEVWALGLPPATTLVAGRSGLGRAVTWVTALRSRRPGFIGLKGGELALLSVRGLRELDGRLTLPEVIERLAEASVAAIALEGDLHPVAASVADRLGIPLLVLPADVDLHEVERHLIQLLVEQRSDMHRRGHELSNELNELVIEGRATTELVDRLAVLLGSSVALETVANGTTEEQEHRRLHLAQPRGQARDSAAQGAALSTALETARSGTIVWAASQRFSPSDPPVRRFELPEVGLARLVAPLSLTSGLVGLLSVIGPPTRLGELERLATGRAAAACALALAREQAVLATEDRLQREVLDELLADEEPDASTLAARAARLGYNIEAAHLALAVAIAPPDGRRNGHDPGLQLDRAVELVGRGADRLPARALLRRNGTSLLALLPLEEDSDEERSRELGGRLHELLGSQLRPYVVSIGMAGPRAGVRGLRTASREAERAASLSQQLFGVGRLTHFADLGLYRLLYRLHGTPEAEEFQREVLGELEAYDRQHGAELISTLDAYFAAGSSPKETASRLYLHRNTVLYRLQRIADISGHRLEDPRTCLQLQLALCLRHTLASQASADSPLVETLG